MENEVEDDAQNSGQNKVTEEAGLRLNIAIHAAVTVQFVLMDAALNGVLYIRIEVRVCGKGKIR